MHINHVFELSMMLDTEKFNKLLTRAYDKTEYSDEEEYIDRSLVSKGVTVTYRDSQYKKKVKLTVNQSLILDNEEPDSAKLLRKLEKRVDDYFGSRYGLNEFTLTGMLLSADIDIGDRKKVADYLIVLQRVGKVKGFSPSNYEQFDNNIGFCLEGNSNGIEFMIYDLERCLKGQLENTDTGHRQLKEIIKASEGLIRAEVRLTKSKAVLDYTKETDTSKQIAELSGSSEKIFLDTLMRVVPFGNFYKKDKAVEIVRKEVSDQRLKRRMLSLLVLIPEKKSLLLAQKALNYRKIDAVMDKFIEINVSPITISKRHDVKKLDNLYKYM